MGALWGFQAKKCSNMVCRGLPLQSDSGLPWVDSHPNTNQGQSWLASKI